MNRIILSVTILWAAVTEPAKSVLPLPKHKHTCKSLFWDSDFEFLFIVPKVLWLFTKTKKCTASTEHMRKLCMAIYCYGIAYICRIIFRGLRTPNKSHYYLLLYRRRVKHSFCHTRVGHVCKVIRSVHICVGETGDALEWRGNVVHTFTRYVCKVV